MQPSEETQKPKIDSAIKVPMGRGYGRLHILRETLSAMKAGDSFLWPESRFPFRAAQQLGIKITTRKVHGQGYRVWRKT